MNQDLKKFVDLLKTDEALLERMTSASESYTGETNPEAVFQNLFLPIAEEAGCHFTWEEFQEYAEQEVSAIKEMNLDEMDQVSGGDSGDGGAIWTKCSHVGFGFGAGVVTDPKTGEDISGVCIGFGGGDSLSCFIKGS